MAFASPNVTAYAVEATEFPDLARRYRVSAVPKTIVGERAGEQAGEQAGENVEILGALPQDAFVAQALAAFSPSP